MCKKRKFNVQVNSYTYPSPNKAIQQNKFELNNNNTSKAMQEKDLKKSCNRKIATNNSDMSNDTNSISSDNITMKTQKMDKNQIPKNSTKEKLGVTALIAIMEPATESQSSRVNKQPLSSRPSNKIRVLLDSVRRRPVFPTQRKRQALSLPD